MPFCGNHLFGSYSEVIRLYWDKITELHPSVDELVLMQMGGQPSSLGPPPPPSAMAEQVSTPAALPNLR